MEVLRQIDESREKKGYLTRKYDEYSMFCKSSSKQHKSTKLGLTFKLEEYVSKHFQFKERRRRARSFLKKGFKSVEKLRSEDELLFNFYHKYLSCIYNMDAEEYGKAGDLLLEMRSICLSFPSFLSENNHLIDICGYKLGEKLQVPEKVSCQWNDINLTFYTEEDRNKFIAREYHKDSKTYEDISANKIIEFEKTERKLFEIIKEGSPKKYTNIYEKCKMMEKCCSKLISFFNENYVSSEYLKTYHSGIVGLKKFYSSLLDYRKCKIEALEYINGYSVPPLFEEIRDFIETSRMERAMCEEIAERIIMEYLDKAFTPKKSELQTPFLPVFYDLAFDHIEYPKGERNISGVFNKLRLFSVKK
jgi:hypothetical protein